ncbi:MAG: Unknown protein [uncultured Sulfurovum sp.]|uniref:Uncharacterized protein n=1 Tax=uncultured Sulfurovum sp. TaxID=269237 RepID=A0A6S6T4R7_9BACT|nr:MAG: Unknown protein [uncultured Sulfurovum sp.]
MTIVIIWTDGLDTILYIKFSITMAIVVVAGILISLALREYGSEKKLKDHNYLD